VKLPSYVKHIQHPKEKKVFWCNTPWYREFAFTGLDHASANALDEGRLLACPDCVEAAVKALESGTYQLGDYPHMDQVKELCRELYKKHKFLSRIVTDDPLYKELVDLGEEAVPALLRRLDCFEEPWDDLAIWEPLAALHDITGETVHSQEEAGRLPVLIERWLDWGEKEGVYKRINWGG